MKAVNNIHSHDERKFSKYPVKMLEGEIPRGTKYKLEVKTRKVGVGYPGLSLYIVHKIEIKNIMPKDRFNTRASWDTSFKYSGQLMPKDSRFTPKSKSSPESKYKSKKEIELLDAVDTMFYKGMNDWEKGFINNLRQSPWMLSPKQKAKVKDIAKKYKHLIPDE